MTLDSLFIKTPILSSIRILGISICLLLSSVSDAQLLEANYWNTNYGTKGQILSGAVVGGINDNCSIFYNPAFIGIDSTQGLSLSLFSPSFSRIKTNSDQLNNSEYKKLSTLPNMVVLDYSIFKSPKFHSSFAIFEREKADIKLLSEYEAVLDDDNKFKGAINYRSKISERLYAAGFSYRHHANFRIGYTLLLSTRNQLQILNNLGSITNHEDERSISNVSKFKEVDFSKLAFLSKFGAFWKKGIFSSGLTLTSPTFLKLNTGASYQSLYSKTENRELTDFESSAKDDLALTYKTPWSIALGFDITPYKNGKLYFTIEHFFSIEDYLLLESDDQNDNFQLFEGRNSVTNYSVGYENRISSAFTLLTGFRSNFHNRIKNYN